MEWIYYNGYGCYVCYAKTDVGFYTIYQDEDRMGFPLCLEFHLDEDDYCIMGAVEVPLGQADTLSEIQEVAENHYKSLLKSNK